MLVFSIASLKHSIFGTGKINRMEFHRLPWRPKAHRKTIIVDKAGKLKNLSYQQQKIRKSCQLGMG